ncbi:UNVERIFIED_CONTAM: hypothetical protein FKN15_022884 [Acipenser sinensis]
MKVHLRNVALVDCLFPAILNLASNAEITANASCGETGPEMFCKLVEHVPGRPIRNPQCRTCDSASPNPRERHPISNAIDGTNNWWQSPSIKNGRQNHWVTITLDLRQVFQVAYIIIKAANSPRPGNWILERSMDGIEFQPWQYYAISDTECLTRYNVTPRIGPPTYKRDDEVICTSYYSRLVPLEHGEVFQVAYIIIKAANSPRPGNWILERSMDGIEFQPWQYYAISDTECLTRDSEFISQTPVHYSRHFEKSFETDFKECNCHNKTEDCYYNQTVASSMMSMNIDGQFVGGGVCIDCTQNTAGINCETCVEGNYRPHKYYYSIKDISVGGMCICYGHAQSCPWDETTKVSPYDENPCVECGCDLNGSQHSVCIKDDNHADLQKGLLPGKCHCKEGYAGEKCDRCAFGYSGYPYCVKCNCSLIGSINLDPCAEQCICKENVMGDNCDLCKRGYYNLQKSSPEGCTECFCFGVSDVCESISWPLTQVLNIDGWLMPVRPIPVTSSARLDYDDSNHISFNISEESRILPSQSSWSAPESFLGNKLTAYGGYLNYTLSYDVPMESLDLQLMSNFDVIIGGNGKTLHTRLNAQLLLQPYKEQTVAVEMLPRNFIDFYTSRAMEKDTLMTVLANLTRLQIQASFNNTRDVVLRQVKLGNGKTLHTRLNAQLLLQPYKEQTVAVEMLPRNFIDFYTSRAMEKDTLMTVLANLTRLQIWASFNNTRDVVLRQVKLTLYPKLTLIDFNQYCCCADYHYSTSLEQPVMNILNRLFYMYSYLNRLSSVSLDTATVNAIDLKPAMDVEHYCGCRVNSSYSNVCDLESGKCACRPNVTGEKCNQCLPGHFGLSSGLGCQTCNCNLAGSVSDTCDDEGQCPCVPGVTGEKCDTCAHGFYDFQDDGCTRKYCEGQSSMVKHIKHDNTWQTIPGHFGLSSGLGCQTCNCNLAGSVSDTCDDEGQCPCVPGVTGEKCDTCAHGFYDFQDDGCTPCNCAHTHNNCNVETGQCICPPHTEGVKCELCEANHWGHDSKLGCKPCDCSLTGASNSQCDLSSGQCQCNPGFRAEKCSECALGFRAYPECTACNCNIIGTREEYCDEKQGVCGCDEDSSSCSCKVNVVGAGCDDCKLGTFALSADDPLGCSPCFCFGVSETCEELGGLVRIPITLTPDQETLHVVSQSDLSGTLDGVFLQSPDILLDAALVRQSLHTEPFYWRLPEQFQGNKPCDCSLTGASNSQCDLSSGQCQCNPGFRAEKCSECALGFRAYPECTACNCNIIGTREEYCDEKQGVCGCDEDSSSCSCKVNVVGAGCDDCKLGTFALSADDPLGCSPCFCFGVSETCEELGGLVRIPITLTPDQETLHVVSQSDLSGTLDGVFLQSPDILLDAALVKQSLHTEPFYWRLPEQFQGNKREWKYFNSVSDQAVSHSDFMSVLSNIQYILIKASYGSDLQQSRISNISLEIAVDSDEMNAGRETARGIERCKCPSGYAGLSCQECAPGFHRQRLTELNVRGPRPLIEPCVSCQCNNHSQTCDLDTGRCQECAPGFHRQRLTELNVRGPRPLIEPCVSCQCNNHSQTCDLDTGRCQGCQDNTAGDHCDLCAPGYYGKVRGSISDCALCACPRGNTNSFSPTCVLEGVDDFRCNACMSGYEGQYCERCSLGYYGNPNEPDGSCQLCKCNPTGSVHNLCDKLSGHCVCKPGVRGLLCDECEPRHILMGTECTAAKALLLRVQKEFEKPQKDVKELKEGIVAILSEVKIVRRANAKSQFAMLASALSDVRNVSFNATNAAQANSNIKSNIEKAEHLAEQANITTAAAWYLALFADSSLKDAGAKSLQRSSRLLSEAADLNNKTDGLMSDLNGLTEQVDKIRHNTQNISKQLSEPLQLLSSIPSNISVKVLEAKKHAMGANVLAVEALQHLEDFNQKLEESSSAVIRANETVKRTNELFSDSAKTASAAEKKVKEVETQTNLLFERLKPLKMLEDNLSRNLSEIKELINQARKQAASVSIGLSTCKWDVGSGFVKLDYPDIQINNDKWHRISATSPQDEDTSFHFDGSGYSVVEKALRSTVTQIVMLFKTFSPNGLLLYLASNGTPIRSVTVLNEGFLELHPVSLAPESELMATFSTKNDTGIILAGISKGGKRRRRQTHLPFFAVMLINGQVEVHMNTGEKGHTRKAVVKSPAGTYSDGEDHSVILHRSKRPSYILPVVFLKVFVSVQPFFAVMLINGQVEVHMNTGEKGHTRKAVVKSPAGTYSDGEDHSVILHRSKRLLTVQVDEGSLTEMRLALSAENNPLNVSSFYIGGVPPSDGADMLKTGKSFYGCIRNLGYNMELLDLTTAVRYRYVDMDSCLLEERPKPVIQPEEGDVESELQPSPTPARPVTTIEQSFKTHGPAKCVEEEIPAIVPNAHQFGLTKNSHMVLSFDESTIRRKFSIQLSFRTFASSGLVYFMAHQNQVDYAALQLMEGCLYFIYDLGKCSARVTLPHVVNDGQWHTVKTDFAKKKATITVDGKESSPVGAVGDGNTLDVEGKLYLGGLPLDFTAKKIGNVTHSVPACISNVMLNNKPLDRDNPISVYAVNRCYETAQEGTHFDGTGFAALAKGYKVRSDLIISFEFRTPLQNGVLLGISSAKVDAVGLELVSGKLLFHVNNGAGRITTTYSPSDSSSLCDGKWHKLQANKSKHWFSLTIDGQTVRANNPYPQSTSAETNNPIYVGGFPGDVKQNCLTIKTPFQGCMRNLRLVNGQHSEAYHFSRAFELRGVFPNSCPGAEH